MTNDMNFIDIIDNEKVDTESEYNELISKVIYTDEKGKSHFIDGYFAQAFNKINNVVYSNGAFYTPNGMESTDKVNKFIAESIIEVFPTNLAANTKKSLEALKTLANVEGFDFSEKLQIPLSNGDLFIKINENWRFMYEDYSSTPYRLPVNFIPLQYPKETPYFNMWLNDLFIKEDILTIQEYLGYCLIPSTKGQKALIILGSGGEGKSILGCILSFVLGNALIAPTDIQMFLKERFMKAELENKLVVFEDDLSEKLLETSGEFKKLVTNSLSLLVERKGAHPFKIKPYAKFIMLSNKMLEAKYDSTDGIYRRLLPIKTKPKTENRINIPNLGELLKDEKEGILQWMLIGLKRLIDNNFNFTLSDRTKEILVEAQELANPLTVFMGSQFEKNNDSNFTLDELMESYKSWCLIRDIKPWSKKTVANWLSNEYEKYGLSKDRNIHRDGKRVRGYSGGQISPLNGTQKS